MNSTKRTARVAGLLYLLMGITGIVSIMYVPGSLIVRDDASATAKNILASQSLFRLGIVSELASVVLFIALGLVLYRLLAGVDRQQASLMVILVLVQVPIAFLNELNNIAALMLLRGGGALSIVDTPQRNALAMLFLKLHGQGFVVSEVFWGLWLLPLGILVFRSAFLPRILGVLLAIACFAYLADSFTSLLMPGYNHLVSTPAMVLEGLGELSTMLWLLAMGAKPQPLDAAASSSAGG